MSKQLLQLCLIKPNICNVSNILNNLEELKVDLNTYHTLYKHRCKLYTF